MNNANPENHPASSGQWRGFLTALIWGATAFVMGFGWLVILQPGGIPPNSIRDFPMFVFVMWGGISLGWFVLGRKEWFWSVPRRLLQLGALALALGVFFLAPSVRSAAEQQTTVVPPTPPIPAFVPRYDGPASSKDVDWNRGVGNQELVDDPPRIRVDKVDLPFEDDPALVGEWTSVDFVNAVTDFDSGRRQWRGGDLFLRSISVRPGGDSTWRYDKRSSDVRWTANTFLNQRDQTAPGYVLHRESGDDYLLVEWKSGDYVYRGMTPSYYVLKRAKGGNGE